MKAAKPFLVLTLVLALLGPIPVVQGSPTAIITVTTPDDEFADPGPGTGCSLREAIQAANTNTAYGGCSAGSGDDVIELPARTYTLTRAGLDDANLSGDLDIDGNLTLNGGGQATTTIDGNGLDRVLDIHSGTVVINDVTITGGQAGHGAAGADGAVVGASGGPGGGGGHGGGIRNAVTLTLNRCTVNGNKAGNGGQGGLGQAGAPGAAPGDDGGAGGNGGKGGNGGDGGGIYSVGTLTLDSCTVSGNQAGSGASGGNAGGGGNGAAGGGGTLDGGDGGAGGNGGYGGDGGHGGGINSSAPLTLLNTTVTDNRSGAGAVGGLPGQGGEGGTGATGGQGGWGWYGGIGGAGGDGGDGGGVYSSAATVVSGCTIEKNRTGAGGHGKSGAPGGVGGQGGSGADGGRGGPGGSGGWAGDGGSGAGILATSSLSMTLSTVTVNVTGGGGSGGHGGAAANGGAGGAGGDGGGGGQGGASGRGGDAGDGGGIASYPDFSAQLSTGHLQNGHQLSLDQCSLEENGTGSAGAGGNGGAGGDGGSGSQPGFNGNGRDGEQGGEGGDGGGLYVEVWGTARVKACTFNANTTGNGAGGGNGGNSGSNLASTEGEAGNGNHGGRSGFGAGIAVGEFAPPLPLFIENSTITKGDTGDGGNGGNGGSGLATDGDGSGGDGGAAGAGGGIASHGETSVASLTIIFNYAQGDGGLAGTGSPEGTAGRGGLGGGVYISDTVTFELGHTILTDNSGGSPNCQGTLDSQGYNIIGAPFGCTVIGSIVGNINNQSARTTFSLADNGGPTKTYLLLWDSPGLDTGDSTCSDTAGGTLTTDQRGYARPVDGKGDGTTRCDMGAVEMQGYHPLSVTVNQWAVNDRVLSEPRGIHCGAGMSDCATSFGVGSVVTLEAQPYVSGGSHFLGWSGDCTGKDLTCPVTMDGPKWVTATFGLIPTYTLAVTLEGDGRGSVGSDPTGIDCGEGSTDCTESYDEGTVVTLTATAATGSSFGEWGGACGGTTTTCQVTMDASKTVSATFEAEWYRVFLPVVLKEQP